MQIHWMIALAAAGCSAKDDCEKFYDKAGPVFESGAKESGKPLNADMKQKFLDGCRKAVKEGKTDPVMPCVIGAKDDAAVKACMEKTFGDFKSKSHKTEASIQLNKIGKAAKEAFAVNAAFPKGKSATLPAKPCCPDKCAVTDEWTKDPAWKALDFQIDEPNLFQYHYDSDGQTFTATAVGD